MLNVKELMIGDYVDVSGHGNPIELGIVEEVSDVGNETTIGLKDCSGILAGNEISPIELTAEFFLKNGFIELYKDEHIVRLYNHDNCLRVNIYPPENYVRFRVDGIDINYVHEFQHYSRLVNLSDYANDLKL